MVCRHSSFICFGIAHHPITKTSARTLIGTDRPTRIKVQVENTGSEAVAPGGVTLEIAGKPAGREALRRARGRGP